MNIKEMRKITKTMKIEALERLITKRKVVIDEFVSQYHDLMVSLQMNQFEKDLGKLDNINRLTLELENVHERISEMESKIGNINRLEYEVENYVKELEYLKDLPNEDLSPEGILNF